VILAALAAACLFTACRPVKPRPPAYAFPVEPSPAGAENARVYEGSLTIPTVKFEDVSYTPSPFPLDRVGRGYPYKRADIHFFRRGGADDEARTYKTVVLENEYLKLTMLPGLGGRLFEAIFKPTGKQVFYRAERLGFFDLFQLGKEWMFATGGLRFEFPTWGHDPNTEEPWDYELHTWPNGTASVAFTRTDLRTGLRARNHVSLDPGRSWIRLDLELANPGEYPERGAFWIITGLTGTPGIEFIMPTEHAIDHGGERSFRWPVTGDVDWAYFRNWPVSQSFFALNWKSDFSGLYDHQGEFGVVRCARPEDVPGLKLWGWPEEGDRFYVSLYGGITQTMEEHLEFTPGQVKSWEEVWYPLAGTHGLTAASREVAVSLHTQEGKLLLGVMPTRVHSHASVRVSRGDTVLFDRKADLTPKGAMVESVDLAGDAGTLAVRVTAADGRVLLEKTLPMSEIRPTFQNKE